MIVTYVPQTLQTTNVERPLLHRTTLTDYIVSTSDNYASASPAYSDPLNCPSLPRVDFRPRARGSD